MSENKKFHWTSELIYKLIDLYKENECLWNFNVPEYKDRNKRNIAMQKICNTLGINQDQLGKKIHNLRNQYNTELKRVKKSNKKVGDSLHIPKWEYYTSLGFLDLIILHKSYSNAVSNHIPNKSEYEEEFTTEDTLIALDDSSTSLPKHKSLQNTFEIFTPKDKSNETTESYQMTIMPEKNPPLKQNDLIFVTEPAMPKRMKLSSPKINAEEKDDSQIFGDFVAAELRNLRNFVSRTRMKREILKVILKIGEEDEEIQT